MGAIVEESGSSLANAGRQARRAAGARHERTLAAVACTPLLGCWVRTRAPWPPPDRPSSPHQAPPSPPTAATPSGPCERATDAAPGPEVARAWSPPAPHHHPAARCPLVCGWRCWGPAVPAAPTAATGPRRTPHAGQETPTGAGPGRGAIRPRRARAPGAGDAMLHPGRRVGARMGQRTTPAMRLPGAGATTTARTHDGVYAAPASVHGTTGRHGGPHAPGWALACRGAWDGLV